MTEREFLAEMNNRFTDTERLSSIDRALALLWFAGRDDPTLGLTAREIATAVEEAGHPAQNVPRLNTQLEADRRTSRAGRAGWRLHPRARRELDAKYGFARGAVRLAASDSVLPRELFSGTRGYIERVVEQINKSYDAELWDCCTVMCRRLLETLIIEVFETLGRAADIKGADGHFKQLNDLINTITADTSINLGRNAEKGLKDFKELGDLSAHNRRFNARQPDIDRVRTGLRVAAEELLYLAGLRMHALPPAGSVHAP